MAKPRATVQEAKPAAKKPAKPESPPAKATKKANQKKEPYLGVAPLKPRNAFNFFSAAQTEFPDGTSMTDRIKIVAQKWATLSDKT